MDNLIIILGNARLELAERKAEATRIEEELKQTQPYQELQWAKEGINQLQEVVSQNEEAIRVYALENYDGENKKVHPAVTIKEFTVVDYDKDVMKEWAISHNHPAMLNLNKRAADKVAKGPTAPDFVKISKESRAQIARNLDDYLNQYR